MRLLKVFSLFLFLFFFQLVLGQATSPTVTLTDTDADNFLSASDTVTITATFSEAMTSTPTISITGVVTNVAMTQIGFTQLGDDIDGEAANDQSGYSVSLSSDGSRVAIGAYANDGNGSSAGHVRIYELQSGTWTKVGGDIDGEAAWDYSGYSVSLSSDGSRVAIGADRNDGNGSTAGHVRIYDYNGSSWVQVGADIDGEAASDQSGVSVSLSSDGSRVAIGAYGNDGNGSDSGHVRIYDYNGSSWVQVGADIDGEAASDQSGFSVSLSSDGSRVAVGAYRNDGNGSDSGHVRVYGETYQYTWNVPSGNDGTVAATVSGTDLFGNYYSGTESLTYRIDNVSPTLTITKPAGNYSSQSVVVTLTYDEAVTGLTTDTAQFQDLTNVASLTLLSASSDGTIYTVLITPAGDGEVILSHKPSFPPVTDIAGNTISSTVSCSFIYDGSPPTINQITSSMADGTYTDYDGNNPLSDTISVTVSFTESVTVDTTNGNPRLLLNTTPATYAYYVDGSGTATLTFKDLVNEEADADPLNVSALELNGGTILDASSNTASLTIPSGSNLADSKSIVVDAKNPIISNYSLSDNNNLAPIPTTSVNDGDIATFGFQSDKELLLSSLTVTFTGFTPTITKTVSGTGPFSYEISFTVSSTFPEGDVEIDISATDQVTTTVVPIGNPTGVFNEEFFTDRIRIDRTAPTITSSANLNSDENTTAGPTITASEGVIFSIDGGADQALLSINQQTGVLTFSSAPDYEAPVDVGADNTYEIIVKAIDHVGLTVTQTVTIQINDLNDTFGIAVTPTDVQTSEDGDSATIGFVLITEPTANVTFGLSLSDTTEGSLSATQLTFTPDNWNTAQTITINGVDDGITDGDVTYQLITANTTSNDTSYNGLVVDDVTLTNVDDEIDIDGDGFFDYQDAFPNDPTEWLDTDNDGIGNNIDIDDDGDGISDEYEIELGTDPLDPNDTPSDFNSNGIPDALEDSDGDGYNDDIDLYPLDPTRAIDNDGDGIADTDDNDDDDDGIPDDQDDFPLDSRYSKDTDNDGIPNLIDPDDDGDGYDDGEDVFPLDGTEHEDTDLDGIGNNSDLDIDGDNVLNIFDICPDTQIGEIVDEYGCSKFILSAMNFFVSKVEKCAGENEISIAVVDTSVTYNVAISGAVNQTDSFSSSNWTLEGLSAGVYTICITVDGVSPLEFERCFEVTIEESDPLLVNNLYNKENQTVSFDLSGGSVYQITHNGKTTQTSSSKHTVQLDKGINNISISTGIECQGLFENTYLNSYEVKYAPNPFEDELQLFIAGKDNLVEISVYSSNGQMIDYKTVSLTFGMRNYSLNTSSYKQGVYIIKIKGQTLDQSIQVIKE